MTGSSTTTVRAMTANDAERVATLSGELGYPSTAEQIRERFRAVQERSDASVWVAVDVDDRVQGWVHVYGRYHLESDRTAEIGGLVVASEQGVWVISRVRDAITTLLSGSLLPLALLPWGIGNVFAWLPFASMASAPLKIYTGTGDPLWLLPVQAGWSIVLWPAALWLWRANREKLVAYGG